MGEITRTRLVRPGATARAALSAGILVVTVTTLGAALAGATSTRAGRDRQAHLETPALSLAIEGITVRGGPGAGIPLTSFRWGVTGSSSPTSGPTAPSRGLGFRAQFTFEVTRPLDQYSPVLFADAVSGRAFKAATLRISPSPGAVGPAGATAFTITFKDLRVLSDVWTGDASGTGQTALSFSFSSYTIQSKVMKPVPTTPSTTTTSTTTTTTTTTTIHITPTTTSSFPLG